MSYFHTSLFPLVMNDNKTKNLNKNNLAVKNNIPHSFFFWKEPVELKWTVCGWQLYCLKPACQVNAAILRVTLSLKLDQIEVNHRDSNIDKLHHDVMTLAKISRVFYC